MNQFYVEPMNIMPGVMALTTGIKQRLDQKAEASRRQKINELFKRNDPDELSAFAAESHENLKMVSETIKLTDEMDRNRALSIAKRGLIELDGDVQTPLIEAAEKKLESGEDATSEITDAIKAQKDPEAFRKGYETVLALYAPNEWKSYKEMKYGKEEKRDVSAMRKDFIDAKRTGEFKGEWPEYIKMVSGAKGSTRDERTSEQKNYDRMVSDPGFANFLKKKDNDEKLANVRKQKFSDSSSLRTEYLKQSEDFIKVRDAKERLDASAKNPSPAGDLAIIFNYMKMLDPGSVVRESEFAVAAQAGSYGQRIQAAVGKVASGERLAPDMRADFLNKAKDLYIAANNQHSKRKSEYTKISRKNGLDPSDVVIDIGGIGSARNTDAKTVEGAKNLIMGGGR